MAPPLIVIERLLSLLIKPLVYIMLIFAFVMIFVPDLIDIVIEEITHRAIDSVNPFIM